MRHEMPKPFDPNEWARRYVANSVEAERNALMDSGWSANVADTCLSRNNSMLLELFFLLKFVDMKPEDFSDRPQLAAVLAAVHEVGRLSARERAPAGCPALE